MMEFRPDGSFEAEEHIGHAEALITALETKFVVLKAGERGAVVQTSEDGALKIENGIVPGRVEARGTEEAVEPAEAGETFRREFVVELGRKLKGFFAEAIAAHEFERFFLLRGGNWREGGAAVLVADMVAIMIEAADEFGGGEEAAIIFVE